MDLFGPAGHVRSGGRTEKFRIRRREIGGCCYLVGVSVCGSRPLTVPFDPRPAGRLADLPVGAPDAGDVGLVERVAAGDRDALRQLYRRHGQILLAQIRFVTGDRGLSEEVLQDTMAAVWRGAGQFRGQASVRSWMVGIARRQARDRLRRHRPMTVDDTVLADRPGGGPGPEQVALGRLEAAVVAEVIAGLSVSHREVLGLVCGSGLSMSEVADLLGIPPGTVGSRLNSARTALRAALEQRGYCR
jgi:RNA polymerase sigma-70 factor (ECF subfamily)